MNDPAPVYRRGGWVCVALLLGTFAGSGITWAVLRHHFTRPPPTLYQMAPPPEAATASRTGSAGFAGSSQAVPTPSDEIDATPSAQLVPQDGVGGSRTILTVEGIPGGGERLPDLRGQNDRILRAHPKAEGCLANALAALSAVTKKGYDLRAKVWDGEVSLDEGKAVSCQLFKGNDYCFCVGTDAKGAKLSLQLYDRDGAPTDAEQSQQALAEGATAMALLKCSQTGTYFVIVKLEAAAQEKVPWGMVSAYR